MEGRRQAPKREVVEIRRRGSYGGVKYDHVLECGHTEVHARASKAKRIACSWCLRLTKDEPTMRDASPMKFDALADDDDISSASNEIEISRIRASLAAVMKVPVDAVEIVASERYGVLEIRAAYVFLSAGDIRRLITRGENS